MNASKPYTLTVIIITKNEQHAIADCLTSVAWVDEIIVVDSGSIDNTVHIAHALGAKVVTQSEWQGFGYQKNFALSLATCDWVLSLDADELVTTELRYEIEQALSHQTNTAYQIPRRSSYCGQYIKHSGWWPDYVLRLFLRGSAKFSDDIVHEKVIFNGKVESLKSPILHKSYIDLEEVLQKMNRYSSDGANKLFEQGKKSSLKKAILHGLWAFLRTYVVKLGFLDGRMGFILAISNAETTYYRYLKLILLQDKA